MSRYFLLLLLNLPFILAALTSLLTRYKLRRISKKRFITQSTLWILVLAGLALAEPIYSYLLSNNLTETDSLSLFDVVQITAIVLVAYIAYRSRAKLEVLEVRIKDLHQEISIKLSDEKS